MIKVAWVRGSYLNRFEGQNYIFENKIKLVGFGSLRSIHSALPFPVIRLPSISDFIRIKRPVKIIANRAFGDAQVLIGLSSYAGAFDIFHTADPHYYYSYQLANLRKSGRIKRLIVTSWETIPFNNESVPKKKEIKRFVLDHADRFLCYTDKAKDCLIEEGIKEEKITVYRLGVDIRRFSPAAPDKRKKRAQTRILFVGRLVEEKGILDLYKAFSRVNANRGNICLKIVGSGPLQNRLDSMIRKDGLTKNVSVHNLSYDQMPDAYRASDLMVLPSKKTRTWEEQYGMVLVEAMATGLPILGYDTGAISEVIGDTGILVKPNDLSGLAATLTSLIKDKKLRTKLGTMGRRRAETHFNSTKTAKHMGDYYLHCFKNI